MSNFTDRMVAAGVPAQLADDIEADLKLDLRKARAERQRLTTQIDSKSAEVDALKSQRAVQTQIIDGILLALNDPLETNA